MESKTKILGRICINRDQCVGARRGIFCIIPQSHFRLWAPTPNIVICWLGISFQWDAGR